MHTNPTNQMQDVVAEEHKGHQALFKPPSQNMEKTLKDIHARTAHKENEETAIFSLSVEELTELHQTRDLKAINELGGYAGLAKVLRTDLKRGISWVVMYVWYGMIA